MNEIPHIQDFLVNKNKWFTLLMRSHLTVQTNCIKIKIIKNLTKIVIKTSVIKTCCQIFCIID